MSQEVRLDVDLFLGSIDDARRFLMENNYKPDVLILSSGLWHSIAGDFLRRSLEMCASTSPLDALSTISGLRVEIADWLPRLTMIVADSKGMGEEAMRVIRCWSIAKVRENGSR